MKTFLFSLLAGEIHASECPADWDQDTLCHYPHRSQYSNISVAGLGTADERASACCAACASDPRCKQWSLVTSGKYKKQIDVCILNSDVVIDDAPQDDDFGCRSGAPHKARCPSSPGVPSKAPKGAKNVLFFAVDDLRPDIDIFGGVPGTTQPKKMHTPNIEALARKSLVLTKNYVQQAVCSPTRQSLLTGRRPDRTRVYDLFVFFREVAANYTTIPQWFRMNGYNTTGMGKIFHPGHASGGDNDYGCSWSPEIEYFLPKDTYGKDRSWTAVDNDMAAKHPLVDTQTANQAVTLLDSLNATRAKGDDRPFFMAVGFHKPHLPFVAAQEYFDLYPLDSIQLPSNQLPPKNMPEVAWSNFGELRNFPDQAKLNASGEPGTVFPEQDVLELRRAYYASISQTDALIGKVLEALERTGEAENTVITFWGDHGWQLGEHGEWCKHTNFEFAARAPMLVHVPGLTDSGIITEHYSEHVDLFPTLTEAAAGVKLADCPAGDASFKVAECTEGSSLVPLMKDPATPVKSAAFSQYPRGYQKPGEKELTEELSATASMSNCIKDGVKGCTMGYTMVTTVGGHEYRYTEWADFNTEGFSKKVNWNRIVATELYNHSSDPGENFNLDIDTCTSLAAKLSKQLRAGPDAARLVAGAIFIV